MIFIGTGSWKVEDRAADCVGCPGWVMMAIFGYLCRTGGMWGLGGTNVDIEYTIFLTGSAKPLIGECFWDSQSKYEDNLFECLFRKVFLKRMPSLVSRYYCVFITSQHWCQNWGALVGTSSALPCSLNALLDCGHLSPSLGEITSLSLMIKLFKISTT